MDETREIIDDVVEKVEGEIIDTDNVDDIADGIRVIVNTGDSDDVMTKTAIAVGTFAGIGLTALVGGIVWGVKKAIDYFKSKPKKSKKSKKNNDDAGDQQDIDDEDNTSDADNTSEDEVSKKTSKRK